MSSAAKPPPHYPEDMILNLIMEWETRIDEKPIDQASPNEIRNFCEAMHVNIEKFQHQKCFLESNLKTKTVYKLIVKLLCDLTDVTDEFSPSFSVAHFFLGEALKLGSPFEILDMEQGSDFSIKTTISNLLKTKSRSELELLYTFFKIVATTPKGREDLVCHGFFNTVYKLGCRHESVDWKSVVSPFKELVTSIKSHDGYDENVVKCFGKHIITRRHSNELKLARHSNCCYIQTSLELLMLIPDACEVIRDNYTRDPICKLISEVFNLLDKNANSVFRTSALLEFSEGERYKGLLIGSSYGGISSEYFHHVIDNYPQLVNLFQVSFDTTDLKQAGYFEQMNGTRIHVGALETNQSGYLIPHALLSFSKFLFVSFVGPSVVYDHTLQCGRLKSEIRKYRLFAFNTTTIENGYSHSSLFVKIDNEWFKCTSGRKYKEKFEKPVADVSWTVWEKCEDKIEKTQSSQLEK